MKELCTDGSTGVGQVGYCDLTPKQEEALDRIVDTTGCSYDDARRQLGLLPDDPAVLRRAIARMVESAKEAVSLADNNPEEMVRYCGDCGLALKRNQGCSHLRVGPRGGVYHSDDPRFV